MTERKGYQTYRSFTQLDQWLTCGECYRLKYVERVREAPSVWTVGGTAFHSCAEWLLRGDLDLADESSARTVDAWESAWLLAMNEAVTKLPEGADPNPATWRAANRGTETPFWWRMEGPRMVGDFAAWWRRSGLDVAVSPEGEVMVEHELLVELGGVPVRVIPDALVIDEHNQFDVLDYKSGNAEKLKRKDPYQLAVYAAGIEVGLGIKATWGLFYGTRAAEAYPHDLTRFTAEQIGEAFARFDADELAGNYKPNPGRHLGLCQTKEKKQ